MPDPTPPALDAAAASRLRRLNLIVGSAHALQAVVLLGIASAAALPITGSFLAGPPGAGDYGEAELGSLRIDWLIAAFLLLAAVDHLSLSAGAPHRWYLANVAAASTRPLVGVLDQRIADDRADRHARVERRLPRLSIEGPPETAPAEA